MTTVAVWLATNIYFVEMVSLSDVCPVPTHTDTSAIFRLSSFANGSVYLRIEALDCFAACYVVPSFLDLY